MGKILREGDAVKISAIGRKRFQNSAYNPHNLKGYIEVVYTTNDFRVTWTNGNSNGYCLSEIERYENEELYEIF